MIISITKETKAHTVTDIAPTIANLLQIEFPNRVTGEIIEGALKK